MGLEKRVDFALSEAGVPEDWYYFSNGMRVSGTGGEADQRAERIMRVLDATGDFGPTRYRQGLIEFGTHRAHLRHDQDYFEYEAKFKQFARS